MAELLQSSNFSPNAPASNRNPGLHSCFSWSLVPSTILNPFLWSPWPTTTRTGVTPNIPGGLTRTLMDPSVPVGQVRVISQSQSLNLQSD